MKPYLLLIILFFSCYSFSQTEDISDLGYVKTIRPSDIRKNKIKSILQWRIYFDQKGIPNDSVLITQSFYDTTGKLTEVHQNFNRNRKEYGWIKYHYNKSGYLINTEHHNIIQDGVYENEAPYFLHDKYEQGKIVESKKYYVIDPDKEAEKRLFIYMSDLLMKTIFYKDEVINRIDKLEFTHHQP